jgi:hypothetical protein
MGVTAVAFGQGQFNFNNRVSGVVDARVFDADNLPLNGDDGWVAQAYVGMDAASLAPVGTTFAFRNAPNPAGFGYIAGSAVTVPGMANGTEVMVEMRVWNTNQGASYEDAMAAFGAIGASNPVTVTLAEAPALPQDLVGLQSFSVAIIPEPSTMALGLLGIGALMLRRRR